ncbi:hypothetical protein [Psychroserpens sp.]|uniref:hypothetical protein n=1 Tax=Psychroserpens sp. TaxID=2020870 RepID=UPI001B03C17F|nr:hypothetical protein [Psychroserpens sp.]MBO6607279.1 hypothetical protein [Psychroserpens sp.]MBO6632552.1 hypothetical protein [Psychroserpens sp.]MBO6654645.1 hypothetical protein [Psychroserpens sp.]MBO6681008.1 hypothetical protein [Psychroserpens sp.]MBO6750037.1 hypothetical protein [Psychroserpens sp.]
MKTQLLYKLLFAFILIPTLAFSNSTKEFKGKHTREKTISKSYDVDSNATLKIMNSYGNINISTYEGSTITFEVYIKTNGNDLEKVEKKLEDIDVEFNASNDMVVAKTTFNKNKSKSWWNWGKNNKINMEINYMIKMPITNNVDLSNDFGSIDLDKIEGRAKISCDYGKITTKELMADNNDISFDYTNNCYFEYIKSGKINADYSSYSIGTAKGLEINADYTKSEIEIAENIDYNCDFGSLKINKVNNVVGNGDYLTLRLGDVFKNVSIKADYGSIKIEKMAANAGNIEIESDFNGITIGYDPAYNFDFDLDLEYASLRNSDDFEFTNKRVKSSDKYYQGYYGSSNSGNMIRIKSEYGSVTFKKQ